MLSLIGFRDPLLYEELSLPKTTYSPDKTLPVVKDSPILISDAYEQRELLRIITAKGVLTVAKRPNDKIFFHICYKGMF